MFCTNCGSEIADAAVICPKCGVPVNGASSRSAQGLPTVPNHMVVAIVSILLCWPVGIASIVFACKVNSRLKSGDVAGAEKASNAAKVTSIIGIALGVVALAIRIISAIVNQ